MEATRTKPKKRDQPRPPNPATLPRATKSQIVADLDFRDQDIPVYDPKAGQWVAWRIHARDVPWSEQNAISDKHTTVTTIGRTERRKVDTTAVVREILNAAVKADKCVPPLTPEDLSNLHGPIFTALSAHLGLDSDSGLEEVEEQGESRAS